MVKRPAYSRFFRFRGGEISLRTAVFIDGYNLYYGLLHGTRYKWLNVRALVEKVIGIQEPASVITSVQYFTSLVKPDLASRGVESLDAQKTYLRALIASGVLIVEGKHRLDKTLAPEYIEGERASRQRKVPIWQLEEKLTDVNIAISMYRMLSLQQKNLPEDQQVKQVVLVSNDSDFSPALKAISEDFPHIQIGIIAPIRESFSGERPPPGSLRASATWIRRVVKNEEIEQCLFPLSVPTKKKPARCPDYWV